MAATVLESLSVPRAITFPTPSAPTSSTISSSSSSLSTVKFPVFSGLKLSTTTTSTSSTARSVASLPRRRRRFSTRVSTESSDTTLQLPALSDNDFKSLVLECDIPVMVEFWAPWCGPCRMVQPIIDELAQEYAGKLKTYKVNTDECPGIASEYGIRSIPTVLIFKGGEKKDAVIGAVPKSTLTTSIEKFL